MTFAAADLAEETDWSYWRPRVRCELLCLTTPAEPRFAPLSPNRRSGCRGGSWQAGTAAWSQRSFGSVASFASSGFTAELLFQCLYRRLTSPPAPPGHLWQPQLASEGTCLSLSDPSALCRARGSVPSYRSVLPANLCCIQWGCILSSRVLQKRFTELEKLGVILCSRGGRHVTTARRPHHVTSQHWFLLQTPLLLLLLFTEQKPPPWGPASSGAPTCPPLTGCSRRKMESRRGGRRVAGGVQYIM